MSIAQEGQLITLLAAMVGVPPLLTARVAYYERKTLFVGTLLLSAGANALAAVSPNSAVMTVARFVPALLLPVFQGLAKRDKRCKSWDQYARRGPFRCSPSASRCIPSRARELLKKFFVCFRAEFEDNRQRTNALIRRAMYRQHAGTVEHVV